MTMDIDFNEDQRMLADSARRFVERAAAPLRASANAPADALADARAGAGAEPAAAAGHWQRFAELGWLALPLPEADEGLGGSTADLCVLAQELGHGVLQEPFIASAVLAAGLLAATADAALRTQWLPGLIDGRLRLASAHSGCFSARALAAGFVLDGKAALLPGGAGADAYLVPAAIEGSDRIALFLLPADAAGLLISELSLYDGQRAAALRLDSAALPSPCWQGSRADWQRQLQPVLERAMLAHAAETVGTMQSAFEITLDYLQARKQFGRTIASNQVVQHRLVDLKVEIEEARALCFAAATAFDDLETEPLRKARMVAAARACVARSAARVWKESVQLHGAIGMTEEYLLAPRVRRLAAACTLYSSEATHLERLAQLAFGDPGSAARPERGAAPAAATAEPTDFATATT